MHVCVLGCVWLCDFMDCSAPCSSVHGQRQEYQSGLPFPSPGDFPDPEIEPVFSVSFSLQMHSLHWTHWGSPKISESPNNISFLPYFSLKFKIIFETEFGGGLVAQLHPTLVTSWTVALQTPLSMIFSRKKYWSGLPFPSPVDLPDPRMNLHLLHCSQILYLRSHQGHIIKHGLLVHFDPCVYSCQLFKVVEFDPK